MHRTSFTGLSRCLRLQTARTRMAVRVEGERNRLQQHQRQQREQRQEE